MPWKRITVVEQRLKFVLEWRDGWDSKAELCRRYGIARGTGYKWAARYERYGAAGLEDLSRAPKTRPNRSVAKQVEGVSGEGRRSVKSPPSA